MAKFIFDTTHNADLFYAIRQPIVDPIFYCEQSDGTKTVFLNRLEYEPFTQQATDPHPVAHRLEPLIDQALKLPGDAPLRCKLALEIARDQFRLSETVYVPAAFPVEIADYLRKNAIDVMPISPFFPERTRKTDVEVRAIRSSLRAVADAIEYVEHILKESTLNDEKLTFTDVPVTSEYLKREVSKYLLDRDMTNEAGIIISSGKQTALPHHAGAGLIEVNTPIIVDVFPRSQYTGYFGDVTRTYVKGKPSSEIQNMYEAVADAQQAALSVVGAGVPARDVHTAAANALADRGYTTDTRQGFIHGTGHGLGLDVHEQPTLGEHSSDILEEGNVITIEPGLYYPEIGGVRIEDVVLITEDGYEPLSSPGSKRWMI